jgi:hypothetical protein
MKTFILTLASISVLLSGCQATHSFGELDRFRIILQTDATGTDTGNPHAKSLLVSQ